MAWIYPYLFYLDVKKTVMARRDDFFNNCSDYLGGAIMVNFEQ